MPPAHPHPPLPPSRWSSPSPVSLTNLHCSCCDHRSSGIALPIASISLEGKGHAPRAQMEQTGSWESPATTPRLFRSQSVRRVIPLTGRLQRRDKGACGEGSRASLCLLVIRGLSHSLSRPSGFFSRIFRSLDFKLDSHNLVKKPTDQATSYRTREQ